MMIWHPHNWGYFYEKLNFNVALLNFIAEIGDVFIVGSSFTLLYQIKVIDFNGRSKGE
jgi:hypothetical protein